MDSGLLSLMPLNSKSLCENLIADECVNINVVEPRKSKYGDFRFKLNNTPSINVNRTNNCYKFLLIFLHEWAHYLVFKKYKSLTKPHGNEWKKEFISIINPFLDEKYFPKEILSPLRNFMLNPRATFSSDIKLMMALNFYDIKNNKKYIYELNEGSQFIFNKKKYKLIRRRRKRFLCKCLSNNRMYLFSYFAIVD